jgi:putative endonuclease
MGSHNISLGRAGEERAAAHYRAHGYVVLAQNWRAGRSGEIDLVVARDDVLVICEVKTRSSERFGLPFEAVDWRKQRRLRTLAVAFLQAHHTHAGSIRFDVASVRGSTVEILEAAF